MSNRNSGFGAFLALTLVIVIAALLFSLSAADKDSDAETAIAAAREATGGAQTREEIMARQNAQAALNVEHSWRLRNVEAASPAQDTTGSLGTLGGYSDADVWRQLRAGNVATASSSTSSGQLMQVLGEDWRLLRRNYIIQYSSWIILGMVGALALFYLIRGRIKIRGGRSGKMMYRFSMSHRIAHWFMACSFIMMAISGMIILLGRPLLVPLIGKEANAILTSAAMQGHNLFGPVFILALLILTFRFMKGNFFQWADLQWIFKGGGIFGPHASAHHYNFGEKTWYWAIVVVGLSMSATGLLLSFPWLTDNLAWHQASTILHAIGAVLLIVGALGHIYIGTLGMEGALDSMLIGEVDENWAKEHHDLWYEEVTGKSAHIDHDDDAVTPPQVPETA